MTPSPEQRGPVPTRAEDREHLPWRRRVIWGDLWHHSDFLRLWAGQTVSLFGSQITVLALPLTAVVTLDATASQVGILAAAGLLPFPIIGLFVGVWVDRLPRQPMLLVADLGRAVLLLIIPTAAILGLLCMEVLYSVAFLVGTLTVFFDVAYGAFLPSLVQCEHLVEGNSKLEVSRSSAQIAGPGLAGVLVQILTAPVAILMNSLSFFASALFLRRIRSTESAIPPRGGKRHIWREIYEGLTVVVRHPLHRTLAGIGGTWNLFGNMLFAVLVLYVIRELGLGAGLLGLIFMGSGTGALLGSLLVGRFTSRVGIGPAAAGAIVLGASAFLLIPVAAGPTGMVVSLLFVALFAGNLGLMIFNINAQSLRQAITPDRLLGRVTATIRVITWGTAPLGALVGGIFGDVIGLWPTLLIAVAGRQLVVLWVLASPLRSLRETPRPITA